MEVSVIEKILNLDELYFLNLKQFVIDLQKESRINNDYFFTDFKEALNRELPKKRLFKSKYYNFINKNKDILINIKCNGILDELYFYLSFNKENKLLKIIEHLYNNYDNKNLILNNLKKIKEIGITEFNFVKEIDEYVRVYENTREFYELNSIYSDGEQKWYKNSRGYLVKLKNHNFMIKYNKNEKRGLISKEIFIKSLLFDSKTLPPYDELYDLDKWQFIDKETIEKKDNIIHNINHLEDDSYKLVYLYNKLLNDIEKLNLTDTSIYKKVLMKINDNLELINLLEQLKSLTFEQNKDIISIEEFNKVKKI